jgi:anti-sigma regulatory factor (Ser/Thr protein kinase)
MPRIALNHLTAWITDAARVHGDDLAAHLMQKLSVSRRSANRLLARLVDAQWLLRSGTTARPRYALGLLRQVVRRYPLDGLDEALPWSRDFAPAFTLPPNVARLAQHAFGELLNNAIDHSGGTTVTVSMRQTPSHLQLLVSDDGCGLFDRIAQSFQIDDRDAAMLELSKGKLTSDPDRHTGRGLFFTARIAEVLDLHANTSAFQHRAWQRHQWTRGKAATQRGTSVFVAIALDTPITLDAVLREHSLDGQGYRFERTVVPLQLLAPPGTVLDSRAQARHAASRLQQFRHATLDFSGIAEVGHGFADELFRVYAGGQPALTLEPINLSPPVRALIDSVRTHAA